MRYIYAKYYKNLPVDKKAILFESFHGKEISDTPLAMARALLAMPEAADYRLYFSTTDLERDSKVIAALGLDIELVHIHSNEYAKLLATAGLLINNSSFPSYYIRREGQQYLQTWHGTPWKTLGKQMKGGIETMHNAQHNFLQASHLLFPNDFTREAIMRDYNLNELFTGKVITHGYPRNSVFCDKAKAAEVKHQCGDDGISTLAYMPTWRGADNKNISQEDQTREITAQLKVMDEALSDDQKLYVNLHPIVQSGLDLEGMKHIFKFPQGVEKYDFINSVDALITDYSSIFFDYSITGKPIILFTYDYDNYVSERGMYFGIEELPFLRVDTLEELTEVFRSGSYKDLSYEDAESYRKRFTGYDTVTAAADLMKYMISGDAGDMVVTDLSVNKDKAWHLVDCGKLATPFDVDVFAESIDPDNDLVVFHQSHISERIGKRIRDDYADAFEYIFTTESVPKTIGEALIKTKAAKKAVRQRNRKRQVGELNIASSTKYRPIRVNVESFRTSGTHTYVELSCPVSIGTIKDVILEYRSNIESITHSLTYTVQEDRDRYRIKADADLTVLKHGCVYWDMFILTEKDGAEDKYHAMLSKMQRKWLKSLFYQCDLGDYIAFPHISLFETLAFTHREKTPYDNRSTRFKEVAAYIYFRIFGRLYSKRHIWLVFEKFCSAAQDNGYYFFKYCMDNLSDAEKKNIYFVIDKNARDYEKNLKPYADHVLQFMSFRHMLYCIAARVYVGSDSRKHLYVWRPKPNLVSGRMRRKPIHFLQHGVTALKRVDSIFGADGSSPMTHITTTSDYEQRIMDEYFGYSPANAPVVGFTRWDVLEDKSTPDEKLILVMPTWRAWLEEKTDEDFLASDYFRNYMTMLQDESLDKCLKDNDVKLIFFIHPKFKDFLGKFSSSSENIELVQFGSRPLNEIMMHCSMLITDYSSVCWDVYYMGKPVVFYQFDYDMYMENHGSYLDMEHDLFGERYTELPDVIESIKRNIADGFTESERAREMRPKYFKYIDNDNSKRTYEYLKKKGY
ncbi:MAG: CDP-glycerol glycerophosphotransferase family protein [Mogibacterium sp.]|nr:CDP-glycerol glycerophosphotransferase family protein [Mogibacterium sp.]